MAGATASIALARRPRSVRVLAVGAAPGEQTAADVAEMARSLEVERGKLRSALAALSAAATQVAQLRRQVLQQSEQEIVALSLAVAQKVLMQEIEAGRYSIDAIVRQAVASLPAGQDVVLRLNPADLERCQLAGQRTAAEAGGILRFIADPSISPAQCVAETSDAAVESTIIAHLHKVALALDGCDA